MRSSVLLAREHSRLLQPASSTLGPLSDCLFGGTQAVSVTTGGIDVKFGWNIGFLQFGKQESTAEWSDSVVGSMDEEGRRRVLVDFVEAFCQFSLFIGNVRGINQDGIVGCAGLLVDLVGRLVKPVAVLDGDMCSQISTGRKPKDTNSFGVELPIVSVSSREAEGALRSGGSVKLGV